MAPGLRRLGNGAIQRAVIEVLARADRPMHVREAHVAVEQLVGHSFSRTSITSCLSTGARPSRLRFERIARG